MLKHFLLKSSILAIVITCTTVLLTSCKDDEETVPVSEVNLDKPALLLIEGQKQSLKATITPENATDKSVTWQSGDESVAAVSDTGEVEAKSAGITSITVTTVDGKKTAVCEVTVQKPIVSVTAVSLDKTELPLLVGEKETLIAALVPENATVKTVTWESSDDAVATVSESGEVEAKSIGVATITVTTVDGEKTATCQVTVDASQFTIIFETNGGSEIGDVVVDKGGTLTTPETPAMEAGPGEGLYLGNIDPDVGSFTFDGWYTEETLENKYDFSTPVTNSFTLYAKWNGDVPQPLNLDGTTGNNVLEKGYNYLNALSLDAPAEYTLVLADDVSNPNLQGNFKNTNVSLLLLGKGEERVISKTGAGNLFLFEEGTLILGNNITITGSGLGGNYPVYLLETAHVIMREGARISGFTGCTGNSAAVFINSSNATFTMEGGEISNNSSERVAAGVIGAAVCVSWGKFYMKGGVISGNSAKTSFPAHNVSGGVYINNWNQFHKTGGTIKGNSAVITATEEVTGKTAQQVFYSANNGNPSAWKKVDEDLNETDDLTTNDVSNPLWKNAD